VNVSHSESEEQRCRLKEETVQVREACGPQDAKILSVDPGFYPESHTQPLWASQRPDGRCRRVVEGPPMAVANTPKCVLVGSHTAGQLCGRCGFTLLCVCVCVCVCVSCGHHVVSFFKRTCHSVFLQNSNSAPLPLLCERTPA